MIEKTVEKDGVYIFYLYGNLETSKQEDLKNNLYDKIPNSKTPVILNFSSVRFIDSACLGVLIGLARRVRKDGGDIRISDLQNEVDSIFQITRLDKVFKIFDNEEDAFSSYQS